MVEKHIRDILSIAMEYTDARKAVVVFDTRSPLAVTLTEAYRRCLPKANFIDFDNVAPKDILLSLELLEPLDLVVLIQSTSFRLEAFRIRVDLFNRSIKVIEHPHLSNMQGLELQYYVNSLAYDPVYYRGVGAALKIRIDRARSGTIESGGECLEFTSGFESAKLNVGDYTQMKNVGGQFPIGEVFTEARDLESVNGRVRVFAFGDTAFKVNKPEQSITLTVSKGRVTDTADSTFEFDKVLANIRTDEGEVWVRELGFGLNRALTQERIVSDIGTYERMCGVHLSLGAKHTIYKKPQFTRRESRHHVDVFASTKTVTLDNDVVYKNNAWQA